MNTAKSVDKNSGTVWAQGDELFGRFKVPLSVSPDDAAGRLLLRTKGSVLLASNKCSEGVVYESIIETLEGDYVSVKLSAQCCKELALQDECEVTVDVQFLINRIPLCEMHDNIARLGPEQIRILFPVPSENRNLQEVCSSINTGKKTGWSPIRSVIIQVNIKSKGYSKTKKGT